MGAVHKGVPLPPKGMGGGTFRMDETFENIGRTIFSYNNPADSVDRKRGDGKRS